MKRQNLSVFIIMYLFLVTILWAGDDFEIGISVMPDSPLSEIELDGVADPNNWNYGGHLAWSPSILYLSWDAFYLPKETAIKMTIRMQGDPEYMHLENSESIVNFIDAGIQLIFLDCIVGFVEIGANYLYVFNVEDISRGGGLFTFGMNLRAGAGVKLGGIGLILSGTIMFPNLTDMADTMGGLISADPQVKKAAWKQIQIIPTITMVVYF